MLYAVLRDDLDHFVAKPDLDGGVIVGWIDAKGVHHPVYDDDKVIPIKRSDKITKFFRL